MFTLDELKSRYGEYFHSRAVAPLDAQNVPEPVRCLADFAAFWGITEDGAREMLVERAPIAAMEDLRTVHVQFDDRLTEWLGAEAGKYPFNREYLAYSAMRRAADYAAILLSKRKSGQ